MWAYERSGKRKGKEVPWQQEVKGSECEWCGRGFAEEHE